eukprot:757862-Hanusia_phi.AAC.2
MSLSDEFSLGAQVMNENVFAAKDTDAYVFQAFPELAQDDLEQLTSYTTGNPTVVFLTQEQATGHLQWAAEKPGDDAVEVFVLDKGEGSPQRWTPLRKETIERIPLMKMIDWDEEDDIDTAIFAYNDAKLFVANVALVTPVWDAINLASSFLLTGAQSED